MSTIPQYQPFNKASIATSSAVVYQTPAAPTVYESNGNYNSNLIGSSISNQPILKYSFTPTDSAQNQGYMFDSFNINNTAKYQPFGTEGVQQRTLQMSDFGNQGDEAVKRAHKSSGKNNNSDSSSDEDQSQVKVLKFHKTTWRVGSIKLAQSTIEQLNNQLKLKESHNNQLIKQNEQKDDQIRNLKLELSSKSTANYSSVPADYERIKNELAVMTQKNNELDRDNRSLALHLEAQVNGSGDAEIWKRKCGELEQNLQKMTISFTQNTNSIEQFTREKNSELARIQQDFNKSQENLQRLEQENRVLQQQVQGQNASLQASNNQSGKVAQLEAQLRDQQNVIQGLTQDNNYLQKQLNGLSGQLQASGVQSQQVSLLESHIAASSAEVDTLRRTLRDQNDREQENERQYKASNQNLNIQFENLKGEVYNLTQQLKIKSQDTDDLNVRCASLAREKEDIRQRLQREKDDEIARLLRDREVEFQRIAQDRSELDYRNQQIIEENRRLKATLDINSTKQQQQLESERIAQQLNLQIQSQQEKIRQLESQLYQAQSETSSLLQRQQQEFAARDEQIFNLKRQLNELDAQKQQEIQRVIFQNEQKLTQLQLDVSNINSQNKILNQDNIDLSQKVNSLNIQLTEKEQQLSQLRRQLNDAQDDGSKRQLEIQIREKELQLQRAISDSESQRNTLQSTNDNLMRSFREKENEVIRLQSLNSRSYELEKQVNEWKAQYEQSRNDILVICQETEKLKEILAQKENENYQLQQQNDTLQLQLSQTEGLRQQIESLRSQNELLRTQINQLDTNRSQYREGDQQKVENAQLKQDNTQLQAYIRQKEDEIYDLKIHMQNRISAPDNNHALILQINQRDQEIQDLKSRFSDYVDKNAELMAQVKQLEENKGRGTVDDNQLGLNSHSDKDQLILQYRVENKRMQAENLELKQHVRDLEAASRNQKISKGWGCSG